MPSTKHEARKLTGSVKRSSRTSEPRLSATPSDMQLSDDSEAETIISSSKQNTPHKTRQLESDDAASHHTNGDDRTSPDVAAGEDHGPSTRKRKAASSSDPQVPKSRGLVSKRVRLTQDGDAHDSKTPIKSEPANDNANGPKIKQEPATAGATGKDAASDEVDPSNPELAQSPKQRSRNNSQDLGSASNRASTHEPRTRSSSPSQASHKRSASLQSSTGPADQERRLRSRRGANETNIPLNTQPRLSTTALTSNDPITPLSASMSRTKDQDRSGRTALFRACEDGHANKVREILSESKHDLERSDYAQNRPLQAAALKGRTDVVQILIDAGADVNCFNDAGDTALIDAIDNNHVDVVQKLLEAGADPWQKGNEYQLPRDRLSDMEDGPARDAIAKLLAKWTDTRSKNDPNRPPVEPPRDPNRSEVFKTSLWGDPDIDTMRKAFLYNNNTKISDLLRHSGVVPDNSCALAAARGGHVKPLGQLVVLDPDPNDVEQTPMLEAIGRGNLEVVGFLLNSEGFNACRIVDGQSYYQLARERQGPQNPAETKMLKAAYRAFRASKTGSQQANIPEASEDEEEQEQEEEITQADKEMSNEAEKTLDGKGESSDESVHSPRTGRRRRLVSGSERAEQQRQKAEDVRNSEETKRQEEEERTRLADEERKAREVEEAEKARLAAEEEADRKRKAAEEEEKKRKEEEEQRVEAERKRKEEEEERRKVEEEARRKAAEEEKLRKEEEERKRAEEEEKRRAEEAERLRKEEEARRAAEEARRIAEEEARKAEEERARLAAIEAARVAREAYINAMPRGFRHALQEMGHLKPLRPAGPDHRHLRTFEDWKPILCVGGNELHECPPDLKDKVWMPNFYATLMLHHERLDDCRDRYGWPSVSMTAEERAKLSKDGGLAKSLCMEQNWYNATPEIISQQSPIYVAVYPEERLGGVSKMLQFKEHFQEARAAFLALPQDQLYWVPLETFIEATKSAKWCSGFKFYTRTGLHVGPPGSYHGALPATVYQDGNVVDHNIQVFQY